MSHPNVATSRLRQLLGLDLRSLALARIGIGVILLADLAVRATDLRAHYTDFGILPREALPAFGWTSTLTLHALASPSPLAVGLLFAVAAAAALALLLGWRTWPATLVSWLLVTSIQYRQPTLCFGGDVMLRMFLFWGLFLPLGARFSLDARRDPGATPRRNLHFSVATVALLLQVCLVYWCSVLQRTGPTWWNGEALYYALHYDQFASRFGILLREHGAWLPPMTYGAIWFEALGPFLLFVPLAIGVFRTLAVLLFLGFHATLGLLFNIGLFPAVFSAVWLGLLPGWFWERLRFAAPQPRAIGSDATRGDGRGHLRDVLAGLALLAVVSSNLSALQIRPGDFGSVRGPWWELPARILHIDQRWGLFAPDPPVHDGWYVIKGVLQNDDEVNLLDPGAKVRFEKPPVVSETMNIRWREYFFRLELDRGDPRWTLYGRWLCRAWDERHGGAQRLARAYVYYVEERTSAAGPVREGILTLMAHDCDGAPRQDEDDRVPPADVGRRGIVLVR